MKHPLPFTLYFTYKHEKHSHKTRLPAIVQSVCPKRHRPICTRRDQVPHVPPRGRTEVHRRNRTSVNCQNRDGRSCLQVPHPQDPVNRTGGQKRVLDVHRYVGDLGRGTSEGSQQTTVDGRPQFYQKVVGALWILVVHGKFFIIGNMTRSTAACNI